MARVNKMYAFLTDTSWTALLVWRSIKRTTEICLYLSTSSSLLILISTIKYGKNLYLLDCANLIVLWLKSQETINFVCFNKFNPYIGSFHLQNKMFNYSI